MPPNANAARIFSVTSVANTPLDSGQVPLPNPIGAVVIIVVPSGAANGSVTINDNDGILAIVPFNGTAGTAIIVLGVDAAFAGLFIAGATNFTGGGVGGGNVTLNSNRKPNSTIRVQVDALGVGITSTATIAAEIP